MDKSVPRVTVWHHSAEPRDAKTMTLGTDLPIRTPGSVPHTHVRFLNSSRFDDDRKKNDESRTRNESVRTPNWNQTTINSPERLNTKR